METPLSDLPQSHIFSVLFSHLILEPRGIEGNLAFTPEEAHRSVFD